MYFRYFSGRLVLGETGFTSYFKDFTGLFNKYTLKTYGWKQSDASKYSFPSDIPLIGISSTLFNILEETNVYKGMDYAVGLETFTVPNGLKFGNMDFYQVLASHEQIQTSSYNGILLSTA